MVLLHRCDKTEGGVIAERIRLAVAAVTITGQTRIRPTVSIGLACWQPVGERTPDLPKLGQRLLKCADEAMYDAKNSGRNKVISKVFCQVVNGGS